ncbi:hypothetical protein KX257_23445, partial [Escherichia coli]|nr:hypothetical protein [Escherichia coli]
MPLAHRRLSESCLRFSINARLLRSLSPGLRRQYSRLNGQTRPPLNIQGNSGGSHSSTSINTSN